MKKAIISLVLLSVVLTGCNNVSNIVRNDIKNTNTVQQKTTPTLSIEEIANYNESGKVMILMYHQFMESEKNEWTRSFDNFKKDLETLYDKGYRPINLNDYINGNIDIPKGKTPFELTFDDGTKGQFNLIEQDGKLVANPKSAVGVLEDFNKTHPDFRLKGTFYINTTGYFEGKGTKKERLDYLINKGFEIGNHTVNHPIMSRLKSQQDVEEEIGGVVKHVKELEPNYTITSLALPNGITSRTFRDTVTKGSYDDVGYDNKAILLVGSNPALSPIMKDVNFLKLPRVRARGIEPVVNDMYYWLEYFDKNPNEKFISDGNPDTYIIPKTQKDKINEKKFNKEIIYAE